MTVLGHQEIIHDLEVEVGVEAVLAEDLKVAVARQTARDDEAVHLLPDLHLVVEAEVEVGVNLVHLCAHDHVLNQRVVAEAVLEANQDHHVQNVVRVQNRGQNHRKQTMVRNDSTYDMYYRT